MKFPWEALAAHGGAMPENLPLAEQKAFQATAALYVRYNARAITPEQASAEKKQIYGRCRQEIDEDNFRDNLIYHHERINRLSEGVRSECRKHPTAENAGKLCDILDGLCKDDPSRTVVQVEHGANCSVCGRFFNAEHAARKPRYCENCGCRLGWLE